MKNKEFSTGSLTITNFISNYERYDLEPPYQRDSVWSTPWKQDLVAKIISGGSIAAIRLVAKDVEESEWEVLDGRQRLGAVLDFRDDKFTIKIKESEKHDHTWSMVKEICKDKHHKDYKLMLGIQDKFMNYNFIVEKYKPMPYADQIEEFKVVNHSKNLSKDEDFISKYVYLRLFSKHLCNNTIKNWYHSSGIKDFSRGKNTFYIFKLLAGLFGLTTISFIPDINKLPTSRSDLLQKFAKDIDVKIKKYMDDNNTNYLFDNSENVQKMYKEFGWDQDVLLFINSIGSFFTGKARYHHATMYFTIFLAEKFSNKKLTKNMLIDSNKEISAVWNEYIDWIGIKDGDEILKTRRAAGKGRYLHIAKLNELWSLSKIDDGQKYQRPTKDEKTKAKEKANYCCEICGKSELELQKLGITLQIDHKEPASLSSIREFGVLCSTCNRKKQDNTISDIKKLSNYMSNE